MHKVIQFETHFTIGTEQKFGSRKSIPIIYMIIIFSVGVMGKETSQRKDFPGQF